MRVFLKTALCGPSNGVYGNEYHTVLGVKTETDDGVEVRRAERDSSMKYEMGVKIWGEYLGNR